MFSIKIINPWNRELYADTNRTDWQYPQAEKLIDFIKAFETIEKEMLDDKPKSSVVVIIYFITCLLVWVASLHGTKADDTQLFVSGSLTKILNARQGQPFLLAVWSLECPPCIADLNLIANSLKEHPKMDVVMISMDDASYTEAIQAILTNHGLRGSVESWIFAEPYAPRLRYEIDPAWYGELPRTYFYDTDHNRRALSGGLRQQDIKKWVAKIGR